MDVTTLPVMARDIAKATQKDKTLAVTMHLVQDGQWPRTQLKTKFHFTTVGCYEPNCYGCILLLCTIVTIVIYLSAGTSVCLYPITYGPLLCN